MFMVPTMFVRLLKLPEEVRRRYDVSSLRFVIHAAAPCPADVKRAMIDWWGPVIYEFYGSTESSAVTLAIRGHAEEARHGRSRRARSCASSTTTGGCCRTGEIGEIFTRFAGLPDFTYHNKPDERAEIDRDGFITSGDVGYLDADGYLFLCDRKRDMVISGGVNIYPAEIEAVLLALAGVKDCAVFGIPDAEFGEALMAVVEPQPGVTLDVATMRAQLRPRSPTTRCPSTSRSARPAARGFRQDLQAPPARSLLAGRGAADLGDATSRCVTQPSAVVPTKVVVPAKAGTHTPRPTLLEQGGGQLCSTTAPCGYGSRPSPGRHRGCRRPLPNF